MADTETLERPESPDPKATLEGVGGPVDSGRWDAPPSRVATEVGAPVTSSGRPGKLSKDEIARWWQAKGYSPAGVAGILQNVERESGFDPGVPGDFKDGQATSLGLFQHHGPRMAALTEFARKQGKLPTDPYVQMAFAEHELESDPRYANLKQMLMTTKDPAQAEQAFRTQFERPAGSIDPEVQSRLSRTASEGNAIVSQMMERFGEDRSRVDRLAKDYKPFNPPPPPEQPVNDPLQAFGGVASIFAMLAAGISKTPAIAAMNGLAGAIQGARDKDWTKYQAEYKTWKDSTDYALSAHREQSADMDAALKMLTTDINAGTAMLHAAIAASDDQVLKPLLIQGKMEEIADRVQQRKKAAQEMDRTRPEADAALHLDAATHALDAATESGDQTAIDAAKKNYDAALQRFRDVKQAAYTGRVGAGGQQENALMQAFDRDHPEATVEERAEFYNRYVKGREDPTKRTELRTREIERKERNDAANAAHRDKMAEIASDKSINTEERQRRLDAETERHHRETEATQAGNLEEKQRHARETERAATEKWQTKQTADLGSLKSERAARFQEAKKAMPEGTTDDKIWDEVTRQQVLAKSPKISPAAARNVAEQVVAGNLGALSGFGRNPAMLAQIENEIAVVAAEKGMTGGDIVRVKAEYAAYTKALKDFATGKQGQTAQSLNVATQHLQLLGEAATALAQNDSQTVNRLQNAFQNEFGWTQPITFNAIKTIVGSEIEKAVTGSAGALEDRRELREGIAPQATPEQLRSVIEGYKGLMAGQLQGLEKTYERTTKRTDFREEFLLPEARREMERLAPSRPPSADSTHPSVPGPLTGKPGLQWNPTRKQWRDAAGTIYNANGAEVR